MKSLTLHIFGFRFQTDNLSADRCVEYSAYRHDIGEPLEEAFAVIFELFSVIFCSFRIFLVMTATLAFLLAH